MGLQSYGPILGRISQALRRDPLDDAATRAQCADHITGAIAAAQAQPCGHCHRSAQWSLAKGLVSSVVGGQGCCLIILLLTLGTTQARGQPVAEPQPFTEVFYASGPLRIQAYLYRPPGNGPFPLVIYNHGSRENKERESWPFSYVGRLLLQSRYAVLVPERRGYGRSDGLTYSEEVHQGIGRHDLAVESPNFVGRLQAESDDVLAALDFIRTLPFVDRSRLGIMGWSFGGIVTMFAVSRSNAFRAAVDQAGGALVWDGSAALRNALVAAARQAGPPILLVGPKDRPPDRAYPPARGCAPGPDPATGANLFPAVHPQSEPKEYRSGPSDLFRARFRDLGE